MIKINPWINFNGNAKEAFDFYKSVFGGEYTKIIYFKDMASEDFKVEEKEANKIMIIELPIGENILTGNDIPEVLGKVSEQENRSKIQVRVENKEELERITNNLSLGGSLEMPVDQSPWGGYLSMFRDKFGIEWIIESK